MKIFVWILLTGLSLNTAYAFEAQAEEEASDTDALNRSSEEDEQSSRPKFSTLVRSTIDLLGPAQDSSETSKSGDANSINQ